MWTLYTGHILLHDFLLFSPLVIAFLVPRVLWQSNHKAIEDLAISPSHYLQASQIIWSLSKAKQVDIAFRDPLFFTFIQDLI